MNAIEIANAAALLIYAPVIMTAAVPALCAAVFGARFLFR